MAIWNGVVLGLLLAALIGPVFFALIQTSIKKGLLPGLFMAIGISLSDACYIIITYLGISQILNNDALYLWMGLIGGAIMIGFGLFSIFKPVQDFSGVQTVHTGKTAFAKEAIKGFLLNGVNPSVLLFWIGIVSLATVKYQYSNVEAILFFASIVTTVLLTDIIKVFVAHKLKFLLNPQNMKMLNSIVGIALVIFGLRLLWEGIYG